MECSHSLSVQEPNRHLLLHIRPIECLAKVLKRNHALAHLIRLQDRPLGNAVQLLLANVISDHHLQDAQQFVPRDRIVVVQVVHLKGESQFIRATIQFVGAKLLGLTEPCEHLHELPKVDPVIVALGEEGVHDAVAQRIDGQFRDAQEVLPGQRAAITSIEGRESGVETFNLIRGDWGGGGREQVLQND